MNIYKIYQDTNNDYDTFDSAIVYARDEERAKRLHPGGGINENETEDGTYSSWTAVKNVKVQLIGTAPENGDEYNEGVILASFNAG